VATGDALLVASKLKVGAWSKRISAFWAPKHAGSVEGRAASLTPATKAWDPVNEPPIDDLDSAGAANLHEFDAVETGLAAFFLSASTKIPGKGSIALGHRIGPQRRSPLMNSETRPGIEAPTARGGGEIWP